MHRAPWSIGYSVSKKMAWEVWWKQSVRAAPPFDGPADEGGGPSFAPQSQRGRLERKPVGWQDPEYLDSTKTWYCFRGAAVPAPVPPTGFPPTQASSGSGSCRSRIAKST